MKTTSKSTVDFLSIRTTVFWSQWFNFGTVLVVYKDNLLRPLLYGPLSGPHRQVTLEMHMTTIFPLIISDEEKTL